MGMSEHEKALLVTGTLDTSGVGGSPYERLDQVAVAFGAEVAEGVPEAAEKAAEKDPSEPEPVKEPEASQTEEKPTARKRSTTKKPQASAPAKS